MVSFRHDLFFEFGSDLFHGHNGSMTVVATERCNLRTQRHHTLYRNTSVERCALRTATECRHKAGSLQASEDYQRCCVNLARSQIACAGQHEQCTTLLCTSNTKQLVAVLCLSPCMSHTADPRPQTASGLLEDRALRFLATASSYGTTDTPPCAHRLRIRPMQAGRYTKHRNCANIPKRDGHDPLNNTLHKGKLQSQKSEKPFFQNNAPARGVTLAA